MHPLWPDGSKLPTVGPAQAVPVAAWTTLLLLLGGLVCLMLYIVAWSQYWDTYANGPESLAEAPVSPAPYWDNP